MKCANKDCIIDFEVKTHNQKYCSDECCRVATNKRIMEKYYEKKAIRNGAPRVCKTCATKLSRYNHDEICAGCQKKSDKNIKSKLIGLIDDIS